jgi:hypothetical protein
MPSEATQHADYERVESGLSVLRLAAELGFTATLTPETAGALNTFVRSRFGDDLRDGGMREPTDLGDGTER